MRSPIRDSPPEIPPATYMPRMKWVTFKPRRTASSVRCGPMKPVPPKISSVPGFGCGVAKADSRGTAALAAAPATSCKTSRRVVMEGSRKNQSVKISRPVPARTALMRPDEALSRPDDRQPHALVRLQQIPPHAAIDYNPINVTQRCDQIRRRRIDLLSRQQTVSLRSARTQGAFYVRLLEIPGSQPHVRTNACATHEVDIRPNSGDRFPRGGSHGHDGMLDQATADEHHFDVGKLHQRHSDRRTMCF